MTDPLNFPAVTPRYALPYLYVGQSQKEVTVNVAHALTDMLLHPVIEGEVDAPPLDPGEGHCWLVGGEPSGAFAENPRCLAAFREGNWTFVPPRDGLRLYDRATGQFLSYSDDWRRITEPSLPAGGGTIDQQARDTIATLIQALRESGIFSAQ